MAQTLLALGDSYTAGEGLAPESSYPVLLADRLRDAGYGLYIPEIIAKTGWTTGELLSNLTDHPPVLDIYPAVLLLIGVNNQYRGQPTDVYIEELSRLSDLCLQKSGNRAEHVVLVSIPDYSVTPFASEKNPSKISEELTIYNRIIEEKATEYGFHFVDITGISRLAQNDPGLLTADLLHPSEKMYHMWVEQILPVVESAIQAQSGK